MPAYSSTNQSSRIFAPYTVVTQSSSRLAVNITTADGLPATGITAGDVIRYDAVNGGYTLSCANTDINSEVMGVVESASSGSCVVVVSGAVRYPTSRLSAITTGGDGGVDVLFLSDTTRGGLTGTINITGGDKIVKPVIQVAPNGIYNGIVVNYIGYKTGSQVSSADQGSVLGPGSVMFGPAGSSPGPNWSRIDSDISLSVSDYSDLYTIYSSTSDKIERVAVNVGSVTTNLIGQLAFQLNGSTQINVGTVIAVDTITSTIDIQKAAAVSLMDTAKDMFVQGNGTFSLSSSTNYKFIVPKVNVTNPPTQNGVTFVPFIKTYNVTSVTIPDALILSSLTVSGTAGIGSYTNVSNTLDDIYVKLNALNAIVKAF